MRIVDVVSLGAKRGESLDTDQVKLSLLLFFATQRVNLTDVFYGALSPPSFSLAKKSA